jgi:hypothetical protein
MLEKDLQDLEDSVKGKPINLDIEILKKRNNIKRNINKLNEEVKNIEDYNAEMTYYSRTGDVIYDYYDLTNGILYAKNFDEDKNDPAVNEEKSKAKIEISEELMAITNMNKKRKLKRPVRKRNKKISMGNDKTVMSYLLGSDEEKEEEDEEKNVLCRAKLQNEYLIMMDKEYACSKSKSNLVRKCKNPKCGGVDKIVIHNESIMTCPKCGESDEIFIESDIPSQRETFNEKPKYPYKRLGHCIEKLNQFLCKGTANVPTEVFTILDEEVEKHGLEKKNITIRFLEKMLKKHRLSDYYEYIMYIYSKMTGKPPQTITREEYELVLKMFNEADDVYEKKYKPKNRNNFLKYTFVLNKIFLTIERDDIAKHFKLLKSPVKMKEQERIWQLICKDKDWTYHGS